MAELWVEQFSDGERVGEHEVPSPPQADEGTAKETLVIKAASHERRGWTIEETPDGFHAWKEYPGRVVERKDRYFRIVD